MDALPEDRDAGVDALFTAHHRSLVAYARLLVDDAGVAEDLVQDAFLQLWRRWGRLRDREAALGYVRTAVLNGARSRGRRAALTRRLRLDRTDDVPAAEAVVVRDESHREVLSQLARLPARQREVLVLRYFHDLSEKEIASTLGVAPGSVKTHASRGLAALSARLGEVT